MDEAEGLSEADRALLERVFPDELFSHEHGYRLTAGDLRLLLSAARAESRSTPDREGELQNKATPGHPDAYLSALLHYTGGFYTAAIRAGMKASEAADAVQHVERAARGLHALARPASSAGGVEEALERALKEAEERAANYAENVARLYKALHNASTWIGEIISNAKAEAATIGVIPTDERAGWERTEALRRSIRYALRRAALTSKGADRG